MEPFHADWFGQYKYDSFCMQLLQKELKCDRTRTMSSMINHLKIHSEVYTAFQIEEQARVVTFETDDNYSIQNFK